jgi:SpoVK/Ycf46/Vps4 family AAA+-type ATPase
MPRVDEKKAFSRSTNGNTSSGTQDNHQKNPDGSSKRSDNSESTIDFSPYLKEPRYSLDDVVLSQETKHQVESVLGELKHQDLIYREWGMGEKHKLDKALSINFSGPPGTGKTISAEAIAYALKRKFLSVPYQLLESKYVGETPKNIAKAFEFATEHKAVLFFDEADSFLGKRLENVTQSSDTAVNLTRSVMLIQLSSFEGIVIFATNLISNYDPAFISRIRRKVQFKLPDEAARTQIWNAQIPKELPLDSSVNFEELASKFDEISGRDIKNAVFQAVVAAASENKPKEQKCVTQSHFTQAITDIIEANKAAVKPELTLNPVENLAKIPPQQSPSN